MAIKQILAMQNRDAQRIIGMLSSSRASPFSEAFLFVHMLVQTSRFGRVFVWGGKQKCIINNTRTTWMKAITLMAAVAALSVFSQAAHAR
ncbi:MAG: hypothetical protein KGI48_15590, partial [Hyphomicrobiales bacterium]|nr:hypothetical protein [Hyphomicrobiales bacterium]